MGKLVILFLTLLISIVPVIHAEGPSSDAENFFDSVKGFCSSDEAWHGQYQAVLRPLAKAHPWFRDEIRGAAEVFYRCPQQLRIVVTNSKFRYELITDGVQAWVLSEVTGQEKRYIEQYNSLEKRELGHWLHALARVVDEKSVLKISDKSKVIESRLEVKKKMPTHFDQVDPTYSIGFSKSKDILELQMKSVPHFQLGSIFWKNETLEATLSLEKVLNKKDALDPKNYFYYEKTGDNITLVSDE